MPESKRKRQTSYLDALGTLDPKIFSIEYGKFQQNPVTCQDCGVQSSTPTEKQTDVNIAVAMLTDAHKDLFDVALLISADSDLCPVVSAVRTLFPAKRVIAIFPPGRASKELVQISSAHFTIGRGKLSQSQFDNEIKLSTGYKIEKPDLWDSGGYQDPH